MMSTVAARPAATVVVVRAGEHDHGLELLFVRRNDKAAFMAGAYVFPGGRVDESDRARAGEMQQAGIQVAARFADLDLVDELAYRVAAVREMYEEASVTLAVSDLLPIAHWVTPEIETRRYDTRFFLARMPPNQVARHDDHETTELVWLAPRAALDRCRAGGMMLPPPTWTTANWLARFTRVDDALAWAQTASIVRVQPRFVKTDGRTMLTLPGDPLYPTIAGWEVPEDTRFVLEEGKGWTPVRAS